MLKGIVNYLGLQLGWLACAWGAAQGFVWLGPAVVAVHLGLHLWWSENRQREVFFIALVTLAGLVIDSVQKATGLVAYAADFPLLSWLAPAWIIAMWALFASAMSGSLQWLAGRYLLAALLGAIFGPLSYRAGAAMGAASFPLGDGFSLGVLAAIWALVLPGLFWMHKRLNRAWDHKAGR
jgi:hypothetical protein